MTDKITNDLFQWLILYVCVACVTQMPLGEKKGLKQSEKRGGDRKRRERMEIKGWRTEWRRGRGEHPWERDERKVRDEDEEGRENGTGGRECVERESWRWKRSVCVCVCGVCVFASERERKRVICFQWKVRPLSRGVELQRNLLPCVKGNTRRARPDCVCECVCECVCVGEWHRE